MRLQITPSGTCQVDGPSPSHVRASLPSSSSKTSTFPSTVDPATSGGDGTPNYKMAKLAVLCGMLLTSGTVVGFYSHGTAVSSVGWLSGGSGRSHCRMGLAKSCPEEVGRPWWIASRGARRGTMGVSGPLMMGKEEDIDRLKFEASQQRSRASQKGVDVRALDTHYRGGKRFMRGGGRGTRIPSGFKLAFSLNLPAVLTALFSSAGEGPEGAAPEGDR